VRIPQHIRCTCGHLGSRHWDDGSCARCECMRFVWPTRAHAGHFSGPVAVRTNPKRNRPGGEAA